MKKSTMILSVTTFMVSVMGWAQPPRQLPAPVGLTANVTPDGHVTLGWQPVDGSVGYHLVVMSGGVGSEVDLKIPSMSYDHMKPGSYSFKVKALGANGQLRDSEFSAPFDFTVKEVI